MSEVERLARTVVEGALRLWAGEDVEAQARREGGVLMASYARRMADRMAQPVTRRLESFLPGELGPDHIAAIDKVGESLRAARAADDADGLDRGLPDLSSDLPSSVVGFYFQLRRECCTYAFQTARSLPLHRPGGVSELVRQENTVVGRLTDLVTLMFAALPLEIRGVLMRCALPERFDEALYDAVLRGDGPELTEMVASGRLARLPGSSHYRLDPALRETAWARWWIDEALIPGSGVPAAMRHTALRISGVVGDELERLRQLTLVSPGKAVAEFRSLYQRADDRFDLVGCQDALDVLGSADLVGISPLIPETYAAHQARLAARTAWATEYRQTGRYLRRDALEHVLTGGPRVVHLHAPGGMGKTMLLRWFAARWCLTRWPHVPCARIDLDAVDPVNAVRHPWLVLLEIAAQLSPQLPGAPFYDLLRDHERWRRVLSRTAVPDTALLSEVAAATADGDDVTRRFFETALPDHVIVFDTLEEIVLRPAADPHPFVEMLARLTGRVVLSGRYDLRDRLPGFLDAVPETVTVEVPAFDDALAARYLIERRGVTRPDLVDAMVRRAGGLPFALAMYGDLAEANPALTAREVEEAREPALLYCLERILERIPDDRLRWLLRYAVLPRHLDAEFVAEVLWSHLEAGLRDEKVLDDPAEDHRPDRKTKIFLPGPPPADATALWDDLTTYAGATSWVQATGDDRLVFHENLRDPVRDLLRVHPICAVLHESAEAHYTRRAARENWARWSAEAAYHAFQHRGKAALPMWRALITEAWRADRPDQAGELADDLLIYATDDEVRYAAYIEQARAAIEAARRDPEPGASGAHWNTAESALAAGARLGEPSAMHHALTAAVLQARDLDDQARRELEAIADHELHGDVAAEVDLVHSASGDLDTVERAYRSATERDDRRVIGFAAARMGFIATAKGGPLDEAVGYLAEAGDVPAMGLLLLQHGLPESAIELLPPGGQSQGPVEQLTGDELNRLLVTAEALIALRRPAAAIRLLTGRIPTDHAPSAIMMARALGDLMEYDDALDALAHARRTATRGSVRAALTCEAARIHLDVAGDADAAERVLGDYPDDVLHPDPLWVDIRLAQDRHEGAVDLARRMVLGSSDVVARVKAAVVGLQVGLPTRERLRELTEQIAGLGLRLTSLGGLRKCVLPVDLSAAVLDPWLAERSERDPGDRAHLDLLAVEVARLAGRTEEARGLLDDAVSWLVRHEGVAWLDWIRARNRLGPAIPDEREPLEIHGGPNLRGTFLVELARRRMPIDLAEATSSRLDRAQELIGDRPMYWHGSLWQARADLAAEAGRPDRDYREEAAVVWRELGQIAKAGRLGPPLSAEPVPGNEIVVVLDGPPPASTDWAGARARNTVGLLLLPGLATRLAEIREAVDVRLTGEVGPGATPWELLGWDGRALGRHPRVRCVYRTPRALVAADDRSELQNRHVDLIQPDPTRASRLRGVPGSLKVADVYRNRDIAVGTGMPLNAAGSNAPAVLHIVGVMDASRTVPAISFLSDDDAIEPSGLHQALRRLRRTPPLVVLDILAPANRAEFHRQLELRNRFAQEVVRAAFPVTVLALGPAPGLTRTVAVTDVALSVSAGSTTPGMWQRIQSHVIDSEDDAFAFAATALFSNVRPPDMPRFGPR
ncbi:ATP-binding protein [Herbidospora mongoliensis]|uniref:ATP-binding protein n=1 Tax=Herbidospora mongoliensis TaxID=688067 RepID=UPI000830DFB9|nr:ATP-binding protein [Herbidospora mongoliensis]